MTAIDASSDDRAALARELQWLGSMLPLGDGREIHDGVADDRVAAIVATALLALPSRVADEAITRALKDLRPIRFQFEPQGSKIIFVHD